MKKPVALIILDGFGLRKETKGNAVKQAKMPFYNSLLKDWPHSEIKTSGLAVGLPPGYQGNSEVGHLNIGAGRVVNQSLVQINLAIKDKSFFANKTFLKASQNCKSHDSTFHIMGLVQDQGVHAHLDHCIALLEFCKRQNLKKILVHVFTDGRDTPPESAWKYISRVQAAMKKIGIGKFATITGRYYAMDRDTNWNRIQVAYDGLTKAAGPHFKTVKSALDDAYSKKETDEFIKPRMIGDFDGIKDHDSVVFFNYRLDRGRELTHAFVDKDFKGFPRKKLNIEYVCLTEYYKEMPCDIAFHRQNMNNILGEYLSKKAKTQLRIAETEKYAHVTFFFNAEREKPYPGEDHVLIHSPKVATYDLQPEMSAYLVTDKLLELINQDKYDVIIMNYANPDMVGHTGKMPAIIKALEVIDGCLSKVVTKIVSLGGVCLITADHGNAEEKLGERATSHTTNKTPFILVGKKCKVADGKLADIAPTMLELLNLPKPKEMTGKSLIR